ncbi:MAG: flagellar M-ring protein FliF [Deltaproteobacteria bacterium]|nr:flagellar M-ring protein FliF [Deltaproteobacteria bacterium]
MEPLLAQLKQIPAQLKSMPARTQWIAGGVLASIFLLGGIFVAFTQATPSFQYVFTELGQDDGAEASAILQGANIPFRFEADGKALAVPASKVHDARLLLASQGIPKAAGVGFELFDKTDIGISEFTQKVNLQRAVEGELARTITSLAEVRSARVHVTLAKKGLFRDEDHGANASVVVRLLPGRTLSQRQLTGLRHLVSSAVPGLPLDDVTLVDGHGAVLSGGDDKDSRFALFQSRTEKELEGRVNAVLEPTVGAEAVVTRVTAQVDYTHVEKTERVFDADNPVLRSEHKKEHLRKNTKSGEGVVGAAGNAPGSNTGGSKGMAENQLDETKNYEISNTFKKEISATPRVARISVAVLIDEDPEKPRSTEEIKRLTELAKHAVGFNGKRGDRLELISSHFHIKNDNELVESEGTAILTARNASISVAALLLLLAVGFGLMAWRKKKAAEPKPESMALLSVGGRVNDIAEAIEKAEPTMDEEPTEVQFDELDDELNETPTNALLERARVLASEDPVRAAHLLHAWLETDRAKTPNQEEALNG